MLTECGGARRRKLAADVRAEYERKIAEEESRCREREAEVRHMEKEELELIERLRKVQGLQKEAFAELEVALGGGGGSVSLASYSAAPP